MQKPLGFGSFWEFQRFVKKSCEFFQPKGVGSKQEEMTCQAEHGIDKFHLRFVAVKRKQEVQSGQTLLGILVLLSCGVCETRNVQNGNCFGLFGTRALRALWILDFVVIWIFAW